MPKAHYPSLGKALDHPKKLEKDEDQDFEKEIEALQLRMLRAQQGIFHRKERAILAFEGFDAAGKGGAIRTLTEKLDPRGFMVHPIGPPEGNEQAIHWLYRFWTKLPPPGMIAIFDRTWYGRVLVERVDKLTPKEDWHRAYREIREFEAMLTNDGIHLIKFFLATSKQEQLRRFEARLKDPYKRWKIGEPDLHARAEWKHYVKAADDAFQETHRKDAPWNLVATDHKPSARKSVLTTVTDRFHHAEKWMEREAAKDGPKDLKAALKELGIKKKAISN